MKLFTIQAIKEIQYEFQIEAENEAEAIRKMELIENTQDYIVESLPLEITDIEFEEEIA